jgi:RNA polymerase sigma-70 factor (ECF subfamily)
MPSKPNGWTHGQTDLIEHIDGLYSYAFILTRNNSEAKCLVKATYIRAIGAREQLRAESHIKGSMFSILRNIWLDRLRRRRNTPVPIDRDTSSAVTVIEASKSPQASGKSMEGQDQVRAAIQRLPLVLREIIVLREYEELSYQEIAKILDCPVDTVMSRLARARSKLRVLLLAILPLQRNSAVT